MTTTLTTTSVAVSAQQLRTAAAGVARFVSRRPAIPVLGAVRVESTGDTLTLDMVAAHKPAVMSTPGSGSGYLIMPVKLA